MEHLESRKDVFEIVDRSLLAEPLFHGMAEIVLTELCDEVIPSCVLESAVERQDVLVKGQFKVLFDVFVHFALKEILINNSLEHFFGGYNKLAFLVLNSIDGRDTPRPYESTSVEVFLKAVEFPPCAYDVGEPVIIRCIP